LYQNNHKSFFATLRNEDGAVIYNPPTLDDIQKYWGGLFGDKAEHNKQAEWLNDEREEMKKIEEAEWIDLTPETFTKTTKKLANWKAPGSDQVQNFWIKHLYVLHPKLTEFCNYCIKNPLKTPKWFTIGRTTLIHKKDQQMWPRITAPVHASLRIINSSPYSLLISYMNMLPQMIYSHPNSEELKEEPEDAKIIYSY